MQKKAVKVLIRTRPTDQFATKNLKVNTDTGEFEVFINKKEQGVVNNGLDNWKFKFPQILHNATQDDVYDLAANELVQSVVRGYNGTIMCYGQTGAGKTYSMLGMKNSQQNRGVIPRGIQQIYDETSQKFDQAIKIRVSYVEIYNEKMIDLLAPHEEIGVQAAKLSILDDQKGGVVVKNLTMIHCETEEDAMEQLFEGEINRTYAAHELNSHSSRSHAIFTVHVESRSRVESTEKIVCSKLHLVDLAGSERTKKTGTSGTQLIEAQHINKSLSFLEQVVLALSEKNKQYIPYRQTTLTNFLRDSLGGNCMTVMVANVHVTAHHLEETISTLKFATRMMKVKNEASVNIMVDPTLALKRYEKELRDLKQELAMHDTLANRGRINYDTYSADELRNIRTVKDQYLSGEIEEIEQLDSLRMIREIFKMIKADYRQTSQQIESIKRQMRDDPEKMKAIQEAMAKKEEKNEPVAAEAPAETKGGKKDAKDKKGAAASSQKKEEEVKEEPKEEAPKEESVVEEPPKKRQAIDKQTAYLEFKDGPGGPIERSILSFRKDFKEKRVGTKELTEKINMGKRLIDKLKMQLDRKEEERKLEKRQQDLEFDDDDHSRQEIIDEEELMMLKDMKELKREYRDNFNQLKVNKSDLKSLQDNIDAAKEQLIYKFEQWYEEEFELAPGQPRPRDLDMNQVEA